MRRYTKNHEWIAVKDGVGVVGLTERRVSGRGEVVYVDLPEVGAEYSMGEAVGVVETKDGPESYLLSPVSGRTRAVNPMLEDDADAINDSPEKDGWVFEMQILDESELHQLMTASDYAFYQEEDPEDARGPLIYGDEDDDFDSYDEDAEEYEEDIDDSALYGGGEDEEENGAFWQLGG